MSVEPSGRHHGARVCLAQRFKGVPGPQKPHSRRGSVTEPQLATTQENLRPQRRRSAICFAACDRQLEAERLFRLKQLNKTAQTQLNHSSEERGERSRATGASGTVCRGESDSVTACFHLWISARHMHTHADIVHVATSPAWFKPPKVPFFYQTSLCCPPPSVFFHPGS